MKLGRHSHKRVLRIGLALLVLFSMGLVANAWAAPGQPAFGENQLGVDAVRSSAEAGLIGVDPASGAPTASIPFELNVARGMIQPRLGLHYAPDVDGEAGRGWTLMLPSIERKPLTGLPTYANDPGPPSAFLLTDRMVFGGEGLVPLCLVGFGAPQCAAAPSEVFPPWATGWWYFRLAADTTFQRFFWSPDKQTWRVEGPDGSVAEYGVPVSEPTYVEAVDREGPNAFRWNLVRQWDAHGEWANPIAYRWAHLGTLGRGYLTDVFDTPREAVDHPTDYDTWAHHVHLAYTKTPYDVFSGGNPRHAERDHHLTEVFVTSANFAAVGTREVVRSYALDYQTYAHHEYLKHVVPRARPEGAGHQSTCVEAVGGAIPSGCFARSLPPITLGYTRFSLGSPPNLGSYFSNGGTVTTNSPVDFVKANYNSLTPLHTVDTGQLSFGVAAEKSRVYDGNGFLVGCGGTSHDFSPCHGRLFVFSGAHGETFQVVETEVRKDGIAVALDERDILSPDEINVLGDWGADGSTQIVLPFSSGPKDPVHTLRVSVDRVNNPNDPVGALLHFRRWSPEREVGAWLGLQGLFFGDINSDGLLDQVGPNVALMSRRRASGVIDPFEPVVPGGFVPQKGRDESLVDVDGDGLADVAWVVPDPAASTKGHPAYDVVYRQGDGRGGFAALWKVSTGARFLEWKKLASLQGPELSLHDVNGDGLADIVLMGEVLGQDAVQVAFNVDGRRFLDASIGDVIFSGLNLPKNPAPVKKLLFIDPLGWGIDGIALVGPRQVETHLGASETEMRAGLLASYDTGRGLSAQVTYKHLTDLERTERSAGGAPIPIDVVESVDLTTYRETIHTRYRYDEPVYDGWRRKLRGFRHVREEVSSNDDTFRRFADTRYLIEASGDTKTPTRDDDPLELTPPLPIVREVYSHAEGTSDVYAPLPPSTVWASTEVSSYRMISDYAVGLDGRRVRFVFPVAVDTFLYDTAPFVHQESTQTFTQLYDAPKYTWNSDRVITNVEHYAISGEVTLRSNVYAHLRRSQTRDEQANYAVKCVVDEGRVGVDPQIKTTFVNSLVAGTDWLWRPKFADTTRFATPAGEVQDKDRHYEYDYLATGELVEMRGYLQGTRQVDRSHENPSKTIQPNVPGASTDGLLVLAHYGYDSLGNLVRVETAGGGCTDTRYDDAFHQLPIANTDYTAGCGNNGIVTLQHYRREFDASDMTIEPTGAISQTDFDDLGRVRRVNAPDPAALGATVLALGMTYDDAPKTNPFLDVIRSHAVGPRGERYTFTDGMGRVLAVVDRADVAAGDAGGWVVSGRRERQTNGSTLVYDPWFATFDPSTEFPNLAPPQQKFTRVNVDAFGRASDAFAQDGIRVASQKYHALGMEVLDEAGVPSTVERDGHGRVIRQTHREGTDVVGTDMSYDVGGEVRMVRQGHSANPADRLVRWFDYDSLGRLVANVEPNSVVNFSVDPNAANARRWIYVHDDAGRIVGTSDPRGCGVNLTYDGAGRLTSEDYSPCRDSQALYSAPGQGGDGYEALYHYDQLGSSGSFALGKLISADDRGAHNQFEYDGRGRVTRTDRQIATPDGSNLGFASRYAPHVFTKRIQYDLADRPSAVDTGADVDALRVAGQSNVTFTYTGRGLIQQIGSSYGVLATTVSADAFGAPVAGRLGDRSEATASYFYDDRHRPAEFILGRADPTTWATSSGGYTPPPTSPPTTLPRTLEHVIAGYDGAGNLNHLYDRRDATEWPVGAKPVDRTMTYDTAHRLTQLSYGYPSGVDSQVSPFAAEEAAGDAHPVPRRSNLGDRVASQSFTYDWRGNLSASDDDRAARFDRSLGNVTYDPVAQNRFASAANGAIRAQHDEAGNLVNLIVERSGTCSAPTGKCVQRYVYDWDELGQLARARRWDYTTLPGTDPAYPAVPPESPAVDLSFEYSQGGRVRKSSNEGTASFHTIDVFDSLRLDEAEFDTSSGDYLRGDLGGRVSETLYLDGVAHVAYISDDVPSLASGHLRVLLEVGDHLGSANVVLDKETGELVEKVSYQAYGDVDSDYRPTRWASFREQRRLTGTDDDFEVGLAYFGGRYYSPNLSRWISPDPLTIHGLGSDLNPYAYVRGSPLQVIDIGGFEGCDNLSPGCNTPGIDVPGLVGGLIDFLSGLGSSAKSAARDAVSQRMDAAQTAKQVASWAVHNPQNVNWGGVQHAIVQNQKAFVVAYAKGVWREGIGMVVQTKGGPPTCASPLCANTVPYSVLLSANQILAPPAANAPVGAKFGNHLAPIGLQVAMAVATLGGGLAGAAGEGSIASRGGPLAGRGTTILPGGSGKAIAGHGSLEPGAGTMTVPEGTSLSFWTTDGTTLPDEIGTLIEQGNYGAIAADPALAAQVEGAYTALPGATVPNYTVGPPVGLTIMQNSRTVIRPTPLQRLVKPNMGNVDCAFCLE